MSYNIDTWRTKKLKDFTIPLNALYVHLDGRRSPGLPEYLVPGLPQVEIGLCELGKIVGTMLTNQTILVSEISMAGEASGTMYMECLEPALKESKGYLEAVLIWEGGDSITRLKVLDGVVTSEEIEL